MIIRNIRKQCVICVRRFRLYQLHRHPAEVDRLVHGHYFVRRNNLQRHTACVFPADRGITAQKADGFVRVCVHFCLDLRQFIARFRPCESFAVYSVHAKSVVPVPVSDHREFRKRQIFRSNRVVEVLHMRGGMTGVHCQSFLPAQNIAQIRAVFGGIKGKNPYMFTDSLQFWSFVHLLSSVDCWCDFDLGL